MQDNSPLLPEERPEASSSSQEHEAEALFSQTPTHHEMPKWLRTELEAGESQETKEVSTAPEDIIGTIIGILITSLLVLNRWEAFE